MNIIIFFKKLTIILFLCHALHAECFDFPYFHKKFNLAQKSNLQLFDSLDKQQNNEQNIENLIITQDIKIAEIWNKQLTTHLKLFEFAVNVMRLTSKYGVFTKFPLSEIEYLFSIFDFSEIDWEANPRLMQYFLGFFSSNIINPEIFDKNIIANHISSFSYDLNIVLMTALIISKIKVQDLNMHVLNLKYNNTKMYPSNVLDCLFFKSNEEYLQVHIDSLFGFFIKNQTSISQEQKETFYNFAKTVFTKWKKEKIISFHEISGNYFWGKYIPPKCIVLPQYIDKLPQNIFSNNFGKYFHSLPDVEISTDEFDFFKLRELFSQTFYVDENAGINLPGSRLSKVKKLGNDFFIKRIDILRSNYPEEEIMISKKFEQNLQKKYPEIKSQEFIGIIFNNGNFYLISKKANGKPYNNIWNDDLDFFRNNYLPIILKELKTFSIFDPEGYGLRERECFINLENGKPQITILDFETLPFQNFEKVNLRNRNKLKKILQPKSLPTTNIKIRKPYTFIIDNKA